jgi:ATP-dependent Clp protease ATP-binding subunit ClpC
VFDYFTPQARLVLVHAEAEARALNHGRVGTHHLLLATVADPAGDAAEVAKRVGVTDGGLRQFLAGVPPNPDFGDRVPFTETAKSALQHAVRSAAGTGQASVTPPDVVAGVLATAVEQANKPRRAKRDGEGPLVGFLASLGLDPEEAFRSVAAALRQQRPVRTSGPLWPP